MIPNNKQHESIEYTFKYIGVKLYKKKLIKYFIDSFIPLIFQLSPHRQKPETWHSATEAGY